MASSVDLESPFRPFPLSLSRWEPTSKCRTVVPHMRITHAAHAVHVVGVAVVMLREQSAKLEPWKPARETEGQALTDVVRGRSKLGKDVHSSARVRPLPRTSPPSLSPAPAPSALSTPKGRTENLSYSTTSAYSQHRTLDLPKCCCIVAREKRKSDGRLTLQSGHVGQLLICRPILLSFGYLRTETTRKKKMKEKTTVNQA